MNKLNILLIGLALIGCENNQKKQEIDNSKEKELTFAQLQDSLIKLQEEKIDFQYFDIRNNDDDLYFFYENGIENPENFVITQLMGTNVTKDEHHPLIDYRPRRDKKFQINKIKVINRRWAIADFTDGLDWGQILVRYTLNDDKTLSFETFDQILYLSEQKP